MAAITITYADLFDEIVYEANIDGQIGSSGRHTPTRINRIINRSIASLRSILASAGYTEFRTSTTATGLPARLAGEDYISIPFPDGALEIQGIDLQRGDEWMTLDPVSFAVRREVTRYREWWGQWSILSTPVENGASAVTAGVIAVFPPDLTGNYKIWYTVPWVPISAANTTFLWYTFPDWVSWVVLDCVIQICGNRDNNKNDSVNLAMVRKAEYEKKIMEAVTRLRRAGPTIPRRTDGWAL